MTAETQTAFISYSREDSEFALRLAEDLKAAGAAVWLDQLDIAPGQRWAKAVEDALNNCPHMLVILSPSSASSTNVDDEVSFALEEKKTVIPVIYRDCRIPFRLRPFQYVDFRGDYDLGLKRLLKTLPAAPQGPESPSPKQIKWLDTLFKTPPVASAPKRDVPSPEEVVPPMAEEGQRGQASESERTEAEDAGSLPLTQEEAVTPAEEIAPVTLEEGQPEAEAQLQRRERDEGSPAEAMLVQDPAIPTGGETQYIASEEIHIASPVEQARSEEESDRVAELPQPEQEDTKASLPGAPASTDLLPQNDNKVIPEEGRSHTSVPAEPVRETIPITVELDRDLSVVAGGGEASRPISAWLVFSRYPVWVKVSAALCAVLLVGLPWYWASQALRSWRPQKSGTREYLNSVFFTTDLSGWVVGSSGVILHTKDAGKTWEPQTSGTGERLRSVVFKTRESGWIVGDDGIILHTEDGRAWKPQSSGTPEVNLLSVYFVTPQSGWAVGTGGTILHTEDGGNTWRPQVGDSKTWLWSVVFPTEKSGWIVGDDGVVLHSDDGGNTWKKQNIGTNDRLMSITFSTAQSALIAGPFEAIFHTDDGGLTWNKQNNSIAGLNSVSFVSPKLGWAVGYGGTILNTGDGGSSWREQASGTHAVLNSVVFTTSHLGWAVGDGGVILHTEDGGGKVK